MKRFGLKAVAAALALTMVASLGVPATAKAAEEKTLLIAPSPKKGTVLEVTQSMVDSEGELVLSGESFDVVVIPNDIEVDRLYLDGCVIGELSIESGNNPEVQVWDSQIKDVTVVPAELVDVNKELGKYLEMMMAQEDQEGFDINGFMNNMVAKNAALTSKAPTVVLKGADMASSTQKIENLNLKANAKLDCTEGKMPAALNVAMEGGKQDVSITVKGFDGNMNVTQANAPEGDFAILSVKAEKSNFKNVNVAATGNGNVVLRSADSKVGTVSYSSVESTAPMNGMFSLDMKADKFVTTAKTANASINLLASVEEVAIDGKAVALNIGSAADVTTATVAGQDNSIAGSGNMTDCTIADGSSASVIMPGANVAGNNTYVPIISAPVREEEDDTTGVDGEQGLEQPTDFTLRNLNEAVVEGNTAKIATGYKSAVWDVPAELQDKITSVKVTLKADRHFCLKVVGADGKPMKEDYILFGASSLTPFTQTYAVTGKLTELHFMSLPDKAAEGENAAQVNLPLEVVLESVEFTFATENEEEDKDSTESVEQMSGTIDLSAGTKISGTTTYGEGGLAVGSDNCKYTFDLPRVAKAGETITVNVDFDFTTLDTDSLIRFYLIQDSDNNTAESVAYIWTKDVDSTSAQKTVTLKVKSGCTANKLMFCNYDYNKPNTPQDVILKSIVIGEQKVEDENESSEVKVDFSTKVKIGGEEPKAEGDSLVFVAAQNKCAFDLPTPLAAGDEITVTADFEFTTMDVPSSVRFYMINDSVDVSCKDGDPIVFINKEQESTSVKVTFTMAAKASANQILFVTYANNGTTPQEVKLNSITVK